MTIASTTATELEEILRAYIDEQSMPITDGIDYDLGDNLHDKLGLDQLDILEMLMHLEELFTIEMPDDDYVSLQDMITAAEEQIG